MKVLAAYMGRNDHPKKRWVKAFPTCSPYLFITPTLRVDHGKVTCLRTKFNLTHKNTGLAVAREFRSVSRLRKIAGAVSGLPLPWAKMNYRKAQTARDTLPEIIRTWLSEVVTPQDTPPTTTKEHVGKVTRKSRKSLPTARRGKGKK